MRPLPSTLCSHLLRTDFSDDQAWQDVVSAAMRPTEDGFGAVLEPIDDIGYRGATKADILRLTADGYQRSFILVVDETTIQHPEHAILVIALRREPGREFRVVPAATWSVENNLSLANMDFHEFADAAGEDGVFRGF